MRFTDTLDRLSGALIVSAQAYPGEAMRDPRTMAQVAAAAVVGGAAGIRLQGIADIRAGADLPVPIVGLWKDGDDEVFITPTLEHAKAVADAGADIVAIDGTRRPRPDGLTLAETILVEGEGAQTNTMRWEDYTQTAVDPSDDCTIWYVGDYVKKDAGAYSTRIGAFRLPGCRGVTSRR